MDTRSIRGLENKKFFEQTLLKARQLIEGLEKNPEVRDYLDQQNRDLRRAQQEKLLAEEAEKRTTTKNKILSRIALFVVYIIVVWVIGLAIRDGLGPAGQGIFFSLAFVYAVYRIYNFV